MLRIWTHSVMLAEKIFLPTEPSPQQLIKFHSYIITILVTCGPLSFHLNFSISPWTSTGTQHQLSSMCVLFLSCNLHRTQDLKPLGIFIFLLINYIHLFCIQPQLPLPFSCPILFPLPSASSSPHLSVSVQKRSDLPWVLTKHDISFIWDKLLPWY